MRVNDYELIYLIQTEPHEEVLAYMIHKYEKFIWKQIHLLDIKHIDQDDFYQEGLMMLVQIVQTFKESKNKTFMRYFELVLKRRFYYLKNKLPQYILSDDPKLYEGLYIEEAPIDIEGLTTLEEKVYSRYFKERWKVKEISNSENLTAKQVYNAIQRIKEKYKNML